ncbi:MAG: polysulfide reductase NrfD [Chloroflexi bacterium]|nr:polysulfide reductase NrfD [Chloroflexota bacterium]
MKRVVIEEPVLRPLVQTGRGFYVAVAVLAAVVLWFGVAYLTQLRGGLAVTGLRDLGVPLSGAPWGLYIATFVWYVGLAHGGIAVSAAARLLKLERYHSIARIAEVLTIITLMMAGANIVIDLGRPDRVINMLLFYSGRVWQSPLVWDFTVILVYLTLCVTYLYLTMREDLASLRGRFPRLGRLYAPLLVGYSPKEKPKVDQIAWWLALTIIFLMVLLSGGVIPWLFGLMGSRVGWYGAVQGPYFLTGALTSAAAGVIIVAAALRKTYGWQQEIKPEIFRHLGIALGILIGFYLWFILHEQMTMRYAGPEEELRISNALLAGRFAPVFWPMLIFGFLLPGAYLFIQGIRPKAFNIGLVVICSGLVVAALWVKRLLIILPSLFYPRLGYPEGSYSPTWVEWSVLAGTLAVACLMYMAFVKLFPMMEVKKKQ